MKVQDFETVQRAVSSRFRDFCLECRDFETGLIFSEMHHFLIDHSLPLIKYANFVASSLRSLKLPNLLR